MIRPAALHDLDAIANLHAEARATYYRGHIPDADFEGPAERARTRDSWSGALVRDEPGAAVLCAERGDTLTGIAAYRAVDGVTTLTQLHVSPARWRQGIGTALHTACVTAWQRAGIRTARLEVYEHNTRAQDFYATQGWRPDPDRPRHDTHLVLRLDVPQAGN
ncbi:GNAT family N-acetyltransferase [Streptomyces sp. NPDC051569]|uniref:GNAT family N-acetyltransferase n=1 Tax=Streptomyces sp. NPDC051569 TaxID=3365661 RepID=UPI0037BBDE23